ncbi:MAG: hypothetical protein R2883_06620 [Caldisericia bacterium]
MSDVCLLISTLLTGRTAKTVAMSPPPNPSFEIFFFPEIPFIRSESLSNPVTSANSKLSHISTGFLSSILLIILSQAYSLYSSKQFCPLHARTMSTVNPSLSNADWKASYQ